MKNIEKIPNFANEKAVSKTELDNFVLMLAEQSPELADLTQKQLEQISKVFITQKLVDEIKQKTNIAGIDFVKEKQTFITNISTSTHTRRAYQNALTRFESYCKNNNLEPLAITPAQADDYIYSLKHLSSSVIRLTVASVSSFYTFLERRHNTIKNPFRGTRARPKKAIKKEFQYPTEKEVTDIIENCTDTTLRLAVQFMAVRGLRVGGLPALKITGNTFSTITKGKEQTGTLPPELVTLKPGKTPFAATTDIRLQNNFNYLIKQLYKKGIITARYSCHDLRHYFAIAEYTKNKDLFTLSKLLNHANIQTTQTYLKGLKIL